MIRAQLPALQVALPLLGAVLCAMMQRGNWAWFVALVVSWTMPFIAGSLLLQVVTDGPIRNTGAAAPWSVPLEPFSAMRRPNSLKTKVMTSPSAP